MHRVASSIIRSINDISHFMVVDLGKHNDEHLNECIVTRSRLLCAKMFGRLRHSICIRYRGKSLSPSEDLMVKLQKRGRKQLVKTISEPEP